MDEEEKNLPAINKNASLEEISGDVVDRILAEEQPGKVDELLGWFNLAQTKKNALRILEWDKLLDAIKEQMGERITKRPHEFTNEELLKYAQVVQDAITKSETKVGAAREDIKHITINQNNVNIGSTDVLSRESREKILSAVKEFLQNVDSSSSDVVYQEDNIIEAKDVIEIEGREDNEERK